ncbi:MAG: HEAT repeat domain-containing protein [Pyrinomonadaceae bacterium]
MTPSSENLRHRGLLLILAVVAFGILSTAMGTGIAKASAVQVIQGSLTPLQVEIEKHTSRLSSVETEERRDAVTRLGSMHHPSASRAALPALRDSVGIVRATAAAAIHSLPPGERAEYLISMLADKDEFVRREVAFALGTTRNQSAVAPLVARLNSDKKDSVRGAAAVALGELRDASATNSLAQILSPGFATTVPGSSRKSKKETDLFLLRAVARSLGQIGSKVGLPALVAALQDEKTSDDVRRESAYALGLIGDAAAIPALRSVVNARDPYLGEAALEAIRKIERHLKPVNGN